MQAVAATSAAAAATSLLWRRAAAAGGPGGAGAAVAVAASRRRRAGGAATPAAATKRDGGGSSGGSSPATTASSRKSPSPQPGGPQRPPPRRKTATALGEFVRSTPGLNRFADGTLVLGDAVMVASTQLSSERIAWDEAGPLLAVSVAMWVLAAAARGDYLPDKRLEYDDPLSLSLGFPVLIGIADACVTWAVAVVPAIGLDSWLAAHFLINPVVVASPRAAAAAAAAAAAFSGGAGSAFAGGGGGGVEQHVHVLSPQLEVLVAMLITMSSWRGIAAWLRLSSS